MASKIVTMIILPLIYALLARTVRWLENKNEIWWKAVEIVAEVIASCCCLSWIVGTFVLAFQTWDNNGGIIFPILCLVMAFIVGIVSGEKNEDLPETSDQRMDRIENQVQRLEAKVDEMYSEKEKEESSNGD